MKSHDGFQLFTNHSPSNQQSKKRRRPMEVAAPEAKAPHPEPAAVLYQGADAKLVAFMYILARDHMPTGSIETLMENHVGKLAASGDPLFTDGNMAKWAINLAQRLR